MPIGSPAARRSSGRPWVRSWPCFGVALPILAGAQLAQRLQQLVELRHLDVLLDIAALSFWPKTSFSGTRRPGVDIDFNSDGLLVPRVTRTVSIAAAEME